MSSPDATEAIRIDSYQKLMVQLDSMDLRVISGPDAGKEASFCLSNLRIGTASDNDLVLSDRAISRHHAELRRTSEGLILRDLGSTNGTFINDLRVTEAYLEPGSECVLGYSRILVGQSTEERKVAVPFQDRLGELVGASEPMRELYGLLCAVAPTPVTVHINGESGSGKELVARTIHELSGREGPLVIFDASVTDPEMVRNDLFGHVKGAFTGATGSREGAFRRAEKGTLFIDEIGELPLDLQPRLLRALENREVTPIGSDKPTRVDVRVVTATHRDLQAMVEAGDFRADLYYRLSVVPVKVPPLREIREDIPLLVKHLCQRLKLGCRVMPEAIPVLQRYAWPGNVRELRNVLERAAVLAPSGEIRPQHLRLAEFSAPVPQMHRPAVPAPVVAAPPERQTSPSLKPGSASLSELKELERQMILEAMDRNRHNKAAVARELGIPLSTLKRRLKEYQL